MGDQEERSGWQTGYPAAIAVAKVGVFTYTLGCRLLLVSQPAVLAARSRGLARVTTDSYLLEGQPNLSYVSNGGSHLLIRILRSDIYSS